MCQGIQGGKPAFCLKADFKNTITKSEREKPVMVDHI